MDGQIVDVYIYYYLQPRSDGEDDESSVEGSEDAPAKPEELDVDQCLELGQEAAHVGDVYEKVRCFSYKTIQDVQNGCFNF